MTREQAINYLISRGLTQEQVGDVVRALTYEPARLSVDEVTALAEWTEKLTKECEDAYKKGYIDGKKAQEPRKGHWIIKDGKEQGYDIGGVKTWYIQIMCSGCGFIKTAIEGHTGQYHYCPNCGAKMVEPQESEDKK